MSLTVDELAVMFGCCRRHLNRLFHQYFGFSVGALKTEMRLLKAVSLLRDVNTKVINVADQCGFNHLGLFNNSFKKRFGVSPGRWRNLASQEKNLPMSGSMPKSAYALLGKSLRSSNGTLGKPLDWRETFPHPKHTLRQRCRPCPPGCNSFRWSIIPRRLFRCEQPRSANKREATSCRTLPFCSLIIGTGNPKSVLGPAGSGFVPSGLSAAV